MQDKWEECMKKTLSMSLLCAGLIFSFVCYAGPFDDVLKGVKIPQIGSTGEPDEANSFTSVER